MMMKPEYFMKYSAGNILLGGKKSIVFCKIKLSVEVKANTLNAQI